MSARKSSAWCVAKECNYISIKRHFFMFPKEYDRWLQWIHACGRYDLQVMGPEYAHRNYRLCHLHFEEKWYKICKIRAHLNPDAIPTIFFGRNEIFMTIEPVKIKESNIYVKSIEEKNNTVDEAERKTENKIKENHLHQQEETNRDIQSSEEMSMNEEYLEEEYLEMFINKDAENVKSSITNIYATTVKETSREKKLIEKKETSRKKQLIEKKETSRKKQLIEKKETLQEKQLIEKKETSREKKLTIKKETLRQKKLIKTNFKLKIENRMLRDRIRRLRQKLENLENKQTTTKGSEEHKTLRQLGQ